MAPASRHSAHVHWQAPGLSVGTLCACQAEALILGWASQTQLGQGSSRRPPGGRPPPGMAHACLTSHQIARRGSPELPAQLLEEKADGEEAQGGRGGEHASAVVLQVPPQAAGEGLWGRGLEAQNLRTTWVREKVGPPPPSIGLHFPRNGHLGHMRTPSPARSPSPLQAPPPGPAAPAIWTLQILGSWAVRTDANSQWVSGCSGHWGPEDTGVRGSAQEHGPSAAHILPGACWSAPEQTSGTQETAVLSSIPDSQHGSPVWVSLCPPSPAQAHPRI